MRSAIAVALALAMPLRASSEPEEWLGDWLAKNEPRVIEYLASLGTADLDRTLPGVELSDGAWEMQGDVYRGRVFTDRPGTHAHRLHRVDSGVSYDVHYIWLDESAEPLAPMDVPCAGTWIQPGGIAVLSGDVYTYSKIGPGRLVVTTCRLSSGHDQHPPEPDPTAP